MATAPPSFSAGNLVPQPAAMPMPNPSGSEAIAGGFGALAGAVYESGRQNRETGQRVQALDHETAMVLDKRQLEAKYADRAVALAGMQAQLEGNVAELRQSAAPGASGHEEKVGALVDGAVRSFTDTLDDPRLRNELLPHVASIAATIKLGEEKYAIEERAKKGVTDFTGLLNVQANTLFTNPTAENLNNAMALTGSAIDHMDLPDDAKAKLRIEAKHDLKVRAWQGAMEVNPALAIEGLDRGTLNDVAHGQEIVELRRSAVALQEHREAQARAQAGQAKEAFKQAARTAIEDVTAGVATDPKALADRATAADAYGETDLAHDLRNAAAMAAVNAKYGPAPPAEKQAALHAIEAKAKWREDPQAVAAHNQIETLIEHDRAKAATDPLSLWSANGGGLAPFSLSDPASVRARVAPARAAQARYGGPLMLMTADEAAPIARQFEHGGPGDKASTIETAAAHGNEAGKALMRQIAPDKPEYAALVDLASMRNHPAGAAIAREALNGWEELKANKTIVAGQTAAQMQHEVDARYGPALAMLDPVVRQGVMDVARGIYATRAVRQGNHGIYDADLWLKSVRAALGDAGDGTGGFGRAKSGEALLLPRGVTQGDFDTILFRSHGPQIEAAAFGGRDAPLWGDRQMSPKDFKSLTPVLWRDDGVRALYMFRSASGYARSKAHPGQNFILDLRALRRVQAAQGMP